MLKYLFSYSVAERLVKLEHLSISSCKLVEEIFVHDEIMSHIAHVHDEIMSHIPQIRKSSHVEMVPIFPNLETLVISNMDNFKFCVGVGYSSETCYLSELPTREEDSKMFDHISGYWTLSYNFTRDLLKFIWSFDKPCEIILQNKRFIGSVIYLA
ncbi:hypothetical protein P8452_54710 [Trifolium repens]|nr:hypothetical protein P8452_54710 [Trifolium repens]